MKSYIDWKGRKLFVSSGISNGTSWMTVYRKSNGNGTKRLVSPALPIRATEERAQLDLDRYAADKGMEAVEQ